MALLDDVTAVAGGTPEALPSNTPTSGLLSDVHAAAGSLPSTTPAPAKAVDPTMGYQAPLQKGQSAFGALPPVKPANTSNLFSGFLKTNNLVAPPSSTTIDSSTPSTTQNQGLTNIFSDTLKRIPDAAISVSKAINNTVINTPADLLSKTKFIQEASAGIDAGSTSGNFAQEMLHKLSYGLEGLSGFTGGMYKTPGQLEQDAANTTAQGSAGAVDPTHVQQQQTELEALKNKITAQQSTVDRTNQKSIDAFNALVDSYNTKAKDFQSSVDDYNTKLTKAQSDEAKAKQLQGDWLDQGLSTLSQAIGFAAGITAIGGIATSGTKAQGAIRGISDLTTRLPLVGKYIAPFIEPLISNAAGMGAMSQLDPKLAGDMKARAKALGVSIAEAPLYTALGAIKSAKVSLPASFTLGFGMAKLSGADNKTAITSGLTFGLLDAFGRAGASRGFTIEEIQAKLHDEALATLNKYSSTKLTTNSTPEEIKAAYLRAAHQVHPDMGGTAEEFSAVKNAYDLVSKGAVSKAPNHITPEETSVKQLRGEIKDSIAKHGEDATHIALRDNLGLSPEDSSRLIEVAKKPATAAEHAALSDKLLSALDVPKYTDSKGNTIERGDTGEVSRVTDKAGMVRYTTEETLSQKATNSLENNQTGIRPKSLEYAKAQIKAGNMPPARIRTLEDGSTVIEDGRHRIEAARQLGIHNYPTEDVTHEYTLKPQEMPNNEYIARPNAQEHFNVIRAEMFESVPGFRSVHDNTGEAYGVSSTFPKWVPEELRSSDLFHKVFDKVENIKDLKYPPKSATKQRALIDAVLQHLNQMQELENTFPKTHREDVDTLFVEIIPGLSKTLSEDVVPGARSALNVLKEVGQWLGQTINPTGLVKPEQLDAVMRAKGTYEERLFKTQRAMAKVESMWNKMPEKVRLDFMTRIERDEPVPKEFAPLAELYKQRLDAAYAAYSKFKNLEYREHYFPHIVKEGGRSPGDQPLSEFLPKVLKRRPLQGSRGYTKQRVFQDVQELYDAGYEMVSTNPEIIMQLHEQDVAKFVMAQEMLGKNSELNKMGALKYVPLGGDAPEGFARIDDAIAKRYLPPPTFKEHYDLHVMNTLNEVAKSLGITHTRAMSGKGLRGSTLGVAFPEQNEIKTKPSTPEDVLIHEIGHVLDHRYGISNMIGSHADAEPFLKDPLFKKELRALADLRYEGVETSSNFKSYVRKGEEKIAVMFQAWLHAPKRFKEVAPQSYHLFEQFLKNHNELRPLLDIRPSLVYGHAKIEIPTGGPIVGGEYWADEHLARIINNHLSPDFIRSNPIGRGLMATKNLLNGIQLGLSGFHATFVTADTMYSKMGIGLGKLLKGRLAEGLRDVATAPLAPIFYYRQGNTLFKMVSKSDGGIGFLPAKEIGDGIDLGNQVDPKTLDLLHKYFVGGGSLHKQQYYNIPVLEKFFDNLRSGNYLGAVSRSPFALIEAMRRPLFEHYIPRLKAGAFVDLYSAELQRQAKQIEDGTITQDTIARTTLNNIDNRMGELNYDNLFWDRTFKGAVMLSIRAPGFNLGTIREIGGALTQDLPRSLGATRMSRENYKKYGFDFTPKMQYTAGMYLLLAVFGALYQYLHTGEKPGSILDLYYPKNGGSDQNNNPMRMEIPSYNKDTYSILHDPKRVISNKSAPEFSMMLDLWANHDYYGDMIWNPADPWTTRQKQMGLFLLSQFQPFSFQQIGNMNKGKTTSEQNLESLFGFLKAPQELIDSEFTAQLKEAYSAQRGAQGAQTPEQKEINTLKRQARQQVQNEDYSSLTQTLDKLKTLGAFTSQKSIDEFLNKGDLTPEERMFQGLTKENRQQLLDAMDGKKPVYTNGHSVDDTSLVGVVTTYAKAIGTDPITAFKDIFNGQSIRRVDNGTIIVNRMSMQESQAQKRALGGGVISKGMTLDHKISLELGGTNDPSNLVLVPADQALVDDQIENYLGDALRTGGVDGATARQLEIDYKDGKITFDDIKKQIGK